MPHPTRTKPLVLLTLAAALSTGAVFAVSAETTQATPAQEAQQFLSAPKTLSDAVAAAEGQTGARAISASYEAQNGTMAYMVELVAPDGTEQAVSVDATSGAVTVLADAAAGDQQGEGQSEGQSDGESGGESQDDNG